MVRHSSPLIAAVVAAMLFGFAAPAFADRAAANACAASLSPEAKLIYAAVIDAVKPDTKLPDVVRSKTRSLVIAGKLSRGQAQPAAEAAGGCLKQAR